MRTPRRKRVAFRKLTIDEINNLEKNFSDFGNFAKFSHYKTMELKNIDLDWLFRVSYKNLLLVKQGKSPKSIKFETIGSLFRTKDLRLPALVVNQDDLLLDGYHRYSFLKYFTGRKTKMQILVAVFEQ